MKPQQEIVAPTLPIRETTPHEKRIIWRIEIVGMKDLKKGDKFVMLEDGAFLHEGRVFVALDDGFESDGGLGAVKAEIL
jgi:hypothetical protein